MDLFNKKKIKELTEQRDMAELNWQQEALVSSRLRKQSNEQALEYTKLESVVEDLELAFLLSEAKSYSEDFELMSEPLSSNNSDKESLDRLAKVMASLPDNAYGNGMITVIENGVRSDRSFQRKSELEAIFQRAKSGEISVEM